MKDKLTTLDKNELEGELNMLTREIVEIARQIEYIKKTIGINQKGGCMNQLEMVALDKLITDVTALRIEIAELRDEIKKLHHDDKAEKEILDRYYPRR